MFRKLRFQTLEKKNLLAADVGILDTGELFVEGTDSNDSIIVSQRGSDVLVAINGERLSFEAEKISSILVHGLEGNDRIYNLTTIVSTLFANRGNDILLSGSGDDDLRGGPDDDRLFGSNGDDELHGDYGNDLLSGGNGDDDLRGWYGDDFITGGNGDDYLSGYLGDDVLYAGNGDDLLRGHEGDDELYGDDGDDRIYGYRGDDLLVGGAGNDYLSGWSGNDILVGGDGNDQLRGHSGRDLIIGSRGADNINGGSGEDFVISGYTRDDSSYAALDQVMAIWDTEETVQERVNNLLGFINSRVTSNDGASDTLEDNRDELDLFVFDRNDHFVDA